jgi:hypothetical protein
MEKQRAQIMVDSRQQQGDPSAFRTVRVSTIVTTDEYGSFKTITRRVAFDEVDAYIAKQVAKYDVSPKSPHTYQLQGLRALRSTI